MKCKCGNEQGKPMVSPQRVRIGGMKKDDHVDVYYMAGFCMGSDGSERCWFCTFDKRPA